jgi:hypothetical protein
VSDRENQELHKIDVKKWFEKLDRFNAVERFVLNREQPDPPERDVFEQGVK